MSTPGTVPVGDQVLGRWLDAYGRPLDGGATLESAPRREPVAPHGKPAAQAEAGMYETGIKAIDFYAPLTRGGVAVIQGPPGTGLIVIVCELAYNLATRHSGRSVVAVVDSPGRPARELLAELRSIGIERSAVVVSAPESDAQAQRAAAHTALTMAQHFVEQGDETLLVLDEALLDRETAGRLRGLAPAGMTTLVWRLLTDSPHPQHIADPDALIALRRELGRDNIWPAVDALASHSRLLEDGVDQQHRQAVENVRDVLRRGEAAAPATPEHVRARRALLFQTQPFSVAELVTARPGVYVDAPNTVATFAAIAGGAYDDVDEAALSFVGVPAPPPA